MTTGTSAGADGDGRRAPTSTRSTLKFALGNLTLVDVHHDPLSFKFRLSGTLFAQRVGMDLTGKWVDELPDEAYRNEVFERYKQVVDSGNRRSRSASASSTGSRANSRSCGCRSPTTTRPSTCC